MDKMINGKPEQVQVNIPYPERHIFETESENITQHLLYSSPQPVFILDRVEYPKDGGIFVYLKGLLYPTKGFPTPESIQANNIVKRYFISQIKFLVKNWLVFILFINKKFRNSWIDLFNSFAYTVYSPFYLKEIRYNSAPRELRKFIYKFLIGVGIEREPSYHLALNLTTMLEYDNAYLFRLQDLANETNKGSLLKNPVKELKRLMVILKQRDERLHLHEKFNSFVFLFSLVSFMPKVKKAFREAFDSIDFTKIQMDDNDRYQVLRWEKYNFFGQTFEERAKKFLELHNGIAPKAFILGS